MSKYQVGDVVYLDDGTRRSRHYQGVVESIHKEGGAIWYHVVDPAEDGSWAWRERDVTLAYRPSPMDAGNEEYEMTIAAQELFNGKI